MSQDLKKKLILFGGIGVGLLIVIIVVALLINGLSGGKKSYESAESTLKSATMEYLKIHDYLLPSQEGEEKIITAEELTEAKFMKTLSEYIPKGSSCKGQVIVKKVRGQYTYTPYLDCGKDYYSVELYKSIIDTKNIVTTGSGLYQMNGEFVYRGEKVNNFIKLDNKLWRIVKVTKEKKIMLIFDQFNYKTVWDDRYNKDKESNVGINDYLVSRMREYLKNLYNGNELISNNTKSKLTTFPLCYSKRLDSANVNDGSIECTNTLSEERIGLLPVYDYINASLDNTCHSTMDIQCQNYNYLYEGNKPWWLITAKAETTHSIYRVYATGAIAVTNASSESVVRPIIYLDSNVMQLKGDGTIKNPYIIK